MLAKKGGVMAYRFAQWDVADGNTQIHGELKNRLHKVKAVAYYVFTNSTVFGTSRISAVSITISLLSIQKKISPFLVVFSPCS